jgi:hypothetical protein
MGLRDEFEAVAENATDEKGRLDWLKRTRYELELRATKAAVYVIGVAHKHLKAAEKEKERRLKEFSEKKNAK